MALSYPETFELSVELHRSSPRKWSKTKDALIIFAKFTGKHLFQGLFFIKGETLTQVFSYEFYKTFKNTYFEEHLSTTASGCRLENHV